MDGFGFKQFYRNYKLFFKQNKKNKIKNTVRKGRVSENTD
jgi:hypothetical protein